MAPSFACHTPSQNLHVGGKDKLASAAFNKINNTPIVPRAPIPAVAPLLVSALFSMTWYLEDNLQRILKIVLDFRLLAPLPTFIPQKYKGPYEMPLKPHFLDVYQGKIHVEYYNFFQQCKDYFATAEAKCQNQVGFAATFLKDAALFCC